MHGGAPGKGKLLSAEVAGAGTWGKLRWLAQADEDPQGRGGWLRQRARWLAAQAKGAVAGSGKGRDG